MVKHKEGMLARPKEYMAILYRRLNLASSFVELPSNGQHHVTQGLWILDQTGSQVAFLKEFANRAPIIQGLASVSRAKSSDMSAKFMRLMHHLRLCMAARAG